MGKKSKNKNKLKLKYKIKKHKQAEQLRTKILLQQKKTNKQFLNNENFQNNSPSEKNESNHNRSKKKLLNVTTLSKLLNNTKEMSNSKCLKNLSLRERMWHKLKSARFRYLNEEMYTKTGGEAKRLFQHDLNAFKTYHEGYKQQVSRWPVNPLDIIIDSLKSVSRHLIIADFGCGDAKLADAVPHTVHSFDLVALNPRVTVCDMANTPLNSESVDIVVFCLSLMGTNLQDYLIEASRVLKIGGVLKIVEIESRFDKVEDFIEGLKRYGFEKINQDFSNSLFYFFDFKKQRTLKNKNKLPTISLNPCLYKKR